MSTWRPLRDRDAEPAPVARPLDAVARRLGAPRPATLTAVFVGWEELVGPDIAAHAVPTSLRAGTLVLQVDHPAWATQIRYMTSDLLGRIASATGGADVTAITVRVTG